MLNKGRLIATSLLVAAIGVAPITATAAEPLQYLSLAQTDRTGGLWLQFDDDQRDWLTRFTEPGQSPVRSTLSLDQAIGGPRSDKRIHWGASNAPTQSMQSLGFKAAGVSVTGFRGDGDTTSTVFHTWNDAGAFQFHGGLRQDYTYSGFALQYDLSAGNRIGFTRADVKAAGLNDRTAYEMSLQSGRLALSLTEIEEANAYAGRAIHIGMGFGRVNASVRHLKADNDASYTGLTLATTTRKGRDLSLTLEQRVNPLFDDANENRLTVGLGFRFGGTPRFNAEATGTEEGAEDTAEKKKTGTGTAILAGAGAVGAAVALSGGSGGDDGSDNRARFASQNAAGKNVLVSINSRSVRENREYGGYVYRNADGSFSSTAPIAGEVASILLPNPDSVAPAGGVTTASYHTHAATDARFDSENFSGQDLFSDFIFGLDGYLGTPRGQFKLHDVSTGRIITLGGPGTLPTAGQ